MKKTFRTYSEMLQLKTFEDRFKYLSLRGTVGDATFGSERYLNQSFYNSYEWKRVRNFVITRDSGCDLGILDREIHSQMYIHHINPLSPDDLKYDSSSLLDMENLITTSHRTHNAIHYGDVSNLLLEPLVRRPGDTIDW